MYSICLYGTVPYAYCPHMTFGLPNNMQLYKYTCSSCGTVLKETDMPIDSHILRSLKNERCARCGRDLRDETIAVKRESTKQQQIHSISSSSYSSPSSVLLPPTPTPTFERAFDLQRQQLLPKFTFGIPQLDSLLDLANTGAICVTCGNSGNTSYWHTTNTLVTRACVRALMPRRYGGIGSPSVIFIDAGNCSDVYECVDFARQYGLDSDKILDKIVVSRPFTIHQLAHLVIDCLQSVIQRFDAKLVIISDILHMFVQEDPQLDYDEARWLLKEIARTLKKLSSYVLIVISMMIMSRRSFLPPQYASAFLSIFDSRIDMEDIVKDTKATTTAPQQYVRMEISSRRNSWRHRIKRHTLTLTERDLQLVVPAQQ